MADLPFRPRLVENANEVAELCLAARSASSIALDTEADSLHSYHHKLCLIQLSFDERHFVIDPLAVGRPGLEPLAELCARRQVTKVMHGADYDLRVLDRDIGARVCGLEDTQVAAQLLGEPQTGLAALLQKELGVVIDKQYQRADWGARPLAPELVSYAVADTAHLHRLAAAVTGRLEELGRLNWWREECAALEEVCWVPAPVNELAFERIKFAGRLRGLERDRVAALHRWREQQASNEDVPPFRIIRNEALLALAQRPPGDLAEMTAFPGVGKSLSRRHGDQLLALLAAPPAAPERVPRVASKFEREREARVKQARSARDAVALQLGLAGGVLAPRTVLEQVVDCLPRDEEALAVCLGRAWRVSVLASCLLPLISGWLAAGAGDAAAQ
ncbi:MAG: HRDC domain-containing protein [Acidobacteriota bacterium]